MFDDSFSAQKTRKLDSEQDQEMIRSSSFRRVSGNGLADIYESGMALDRYHSSTVEEDVDIDTMLQSHRRKIQRRQANRKSAQLSRARKKANFEELQKENSRLRKMVEVLESQQDLVFCADVDGKISYLSPYVLELVINPSSRESVDLRQILCDKDAEKVLGFIRRKELNVIFNVTYKTRSGLSCTGSIRFNQLQRKRMEDTEEKKSSKRKSAAIDGGESDGDSSKTGWSTPHDSVADDISMVRSRDPHIEEYVFVIRPNVEQSAQQADLMRNPLHLFSHALSRASMTGHERQDQTGVEEDNTDDADGTSGNDDESNDSGQSSS